MFRDNRCMYMPHAFLFVVVTVWGSAECVLCSGRCLDSGFLSLVVLKYVVCLCKGCDGCCVFSLYCDVLSYRCSFMGSMSVSSCRCCMFVSCVLCASCGSSQCFILHDLQFVSAGQGCKRRPYGRGILQSLSHDCLIGIHECILLFTPSGCCDCFYHL